MTALFFPQKGEIKTVEASIGRDGQAHVGSIIHGTRHTITVNIDEYLKGSIQTFTVIYTHKPDEPENESIRDKLRLGWRGEILILNNWPGLTDPNANEEEYGEYNMDTGEFKDAKLFTDINLEDEEEEENTMMAAGTAHHHHITINHTEFSKNVGFAIKDLLQCLNTTGNLLPDMFSCMH